MVYGLRSTVYGLFAVAFLAACSRPRPVLSSPSSVPAADTAVGRVVEVGPDPVSWMALTLSSGAQLRLSGPVAQVLRAVSGATVWITGAREPNAFRVDAFEVRAVNDQPVDDGVVMVTPTAVAIRIRSGVQRDVPDAPPALREMAGARIWISRPVVGVAPSYGLIKAP